ITLTLLGNPTAHSVQLQSPEYQQLRYQLHDLQGRLLLSENDLPDATTRIDLSQLPAQIYILSVYTEQRAYPIKNFKIIKQ
ncbi:MAG: T9SS type A sorting domain-containing protein, partial [Bacteroidota bacterium]